MIFRMYKGLGAVLTWIGVKFYASLDQAKLKFRIWKKWIYFYKTSLNLRMGLEIRQPDPLESHLCPRQSGHVTLEAKRPFGRSKYLTPSHDCSPLGDCGTRPACFVQISNLQSVQGSEEQPKKRRFEWLVREITKYSRNYKLNLF